MAIDYTKRGGSSAPGPDVSAPIASAPDEAAPVAAPGAAPISLSKVTLTKASPSISLSKRGAATGMLRVNLNWNARPAGGGGFLKRLTEPSIDLDLGALYEFTDGSKGVVQALGNAFTSAQSFTSSPVVRLDGDDRSGTSSGGENLFVDLTFTPQIKRILVFASIYSGVRNWAAADGVVTLYPVGSAPIEVRLDEAEAGSPICAIAMLENVGGDLEVRREVRYVQGSQSVLDTTYGWGMSWTPGRK